MIRFSTLTTLGLLVFAAPALAGDVVIVQQDKSFSAAEISVGVGDTVVFKNKDRVVHNVFSRSVGNEFEVRAQLPGQENSVTLREEGTVHARCAIHPEMKLIVHVGSPKSVSRDAAAGASVLPAAAAAAAAAAEEAGGSAKGE